MTQKRLNPACEDGVLNCLAWRLDASDYNPLASEYNLRLSHLQHWHGLTGARTELIASLAFDGGRR